MQVKISIYLLSCSTIFVYSHYENSCWQQIKYFRITRHNQVLWPNTLSYSVKNFAKIIVRTFLKIIFICRKELYFFTTPNNISHWLQSLFNVLFIVSSILLEGWPRLYEDMKNQWFLHKADVGSKTQIWLSALLWNIFSLFFISPYNTRYPFDFYFRIICRSVAFTSINSLS